MQVVLPVYSDLNETFVEKVLSCFQRNDLKRMLASRSVEVEVHWNVSTLRSN